MTDLLAALDAVLATPDAQALSLDSDADRARLRELVAAEVDDRPKERHRSAPRATMSPATVEAKPPTSDELLAASDRVLAAGAGDAVTLAAFVRDLLGRPAGDTIAILEVMRVAAAEYKLGVVANMVRLRDVAADLIRAVEGWR